MCAISSHTSDVRPQRGHGVWRRAVTGQASARPMGPRLTASEHGEGLGCHLGAAGGQVPRVYSQAQTGSLPQTWSQISAGGGLPALPRFSCGPECGSGTLGLAPWNPGDTSPWPWGSPCHPCSCPWSLKLQPCPIFLLYLSLRQVLGSRGRVLGRGPGSGKCLVVILPHPWRPVQASHREASQVPPFRNPLHPTSAQHRAPNDLVSFTSPACQGK